MLSIHILECPFDDTRDIPLLLVSMQAMPAIAGPYHFLQLSKREESGCGVGLGTLGMWSAKAWAMRVPRRGPAISNMWSRNGMARVCTTSEDIIRPFIGEYWIFFSYQNVMQFQFPTKQESWDFNFLRWGIEVAFHPRTQGGIDYVPCMRPQKGEFFCGLSYSGPIKCPSFLSCTLSARLRLKNC